MPRATPPHSPTSTAATSLLNHDQRSPTRHSHPDRSVPGTSAESLAKGNRAVVVGRLKTRSWETPEGEKRSVVEIDAAEVAPA